MDPSNTCESSVGLTPGVNKLSSEYGKIDQAVHGEGLFGARILLLVLGVFTFFYHAVQLVNVPDEVEKVIREEMRSLGSDEVIDQEELVAFRQEAAQRGYWVYGLTAVTGLVIFLLGVFLYRAPVLFVVTGLILYAGCVACFAILDPESLSHRIVKHVVVLLVLSRAVQSAFAYRHAARAAQGKISRSWADIRAVG